MNIFAPIAFAEGQGGEQANSPGVPGQKPLSFVSVTLADGKNVQNAADIPLKPKFNLHFDKNVVNSLFWQNNSQCFTLTSSNNENIPITVSKIDDTINFSKRQFIFVEPNDSLKPGTTYQLKVSPKLQAKNGYSTLGGTTNGQGITITFKTQGAGGQASASLNSTTFSSNGGTQSTGQSGRSAADWAVIIGCVIIGGWLVFEIFIRLTKKKSK